MADGIQEKIDINTAQVGELTQLPGIAINMARSIVNHRQRHGLFTAIEELGGIKQFPMERLEEIRERITLGEMEGMPAPRHLQKNHREIPAKKTSGQGKSLRRAKGNAA